MLLAPLCLESVVASTGLFSPMEVKQEAAEPVWGLPDGWDSDVICLEDTPPPTSEAQQAPPARKECFSGQCTDGVHDVVAFPVLILPHACTQALRQYTSMDANVQG